MSKYAPVADNNNPSSYTDKIVNFFKTKGVDITRNTPIKDLSTKLWAQAISMLEDSESYKNLVSLQLFD